MTAYLRDVTVEEVGRLLQRTCPAQSGPPWIWERGGDPCLYIQCQPGGAYDFAFDADVRRSVVDGLEGAPSVTVLVEVAGRHAGDEEVRELLSALLRRFRGVAQDEYTSHSWTLGDLMSGQKVDGHSFFDYRRRVAAGRKKGEPDLIGAGDLSLIARLCLALSCFERYCRATSLESQSIRDFFEYMWEWPLRLITPDVFAEWEQKATGLVEMGLGGPPPEDVASLLVEKHIDPVAFRRLVESTVEIIWGSFYGASDNKGSLESLARVVSICRGRGVSIPPVVEFAESRFTQGRGWGAHVTREQRDRWKRLAMSPSPRPEGK